MNDSQIAARLVATRSKPAPTRPKRPTVDPDVVAAVMAKQMHAIVKPLQTRISKLEKALAHALAAVEAEITTEIDAFLDPADEPTLEELERRAAEHKKSMEELR